MVNVFVTTSSRQKHHTVVDIRHLERILADDKTAAAICTKSQPTRRGKQKQTNRFFFFSLQARNTERITDHSILMVSNMLTVQQTPTGIDTQRKLNERVQTAGIRENSHTEEIQK